VRKSDWSSQALVDTLSPGLLSRFELLGTHAAEMTVTASLIVELLDVVSYVGQSELSGLVDVFLDSLFLQIAEERLCHGVVASVPLPAHARLQAIRSAEAPPGIASVLGSLIRMDHGAAWRSWAYGHHHRVEHELTVDRRARRPADDPGREQIHDDCQIHPALPRPNVGDVCHPSLVGACHRELSPQNIRDQDGWLADRPASGSIAMKCAQVVQSHEARDTVLAAGVACLTQVQEDDSPRFRVEVWNCCSGGCRGGSRS
jgi:hypothetical protein